MSETGQFDAWAPVMIPKPALRLHLKEPDYSRPALQLTDGQRQNIEEKLAILYGRERAEACLPEIERILRIHYAHKTPEMIEEEKSFDPRNRFTEKDIIVITYGGFIRNTARPPLQVLRDILLLFLRGVANTVHILPFFPYSSDRGFSIIDYREVDPRLGTWEDIEALSLRFRLMFDGVFNHVSSKSQWFQEFLNGNPEYQDFFITFSTKTAISDEQLRLIFRPRTTDLLTAFQTVNGLKYVWTTFSRDQIDLNYRNEQVLLRILQVLLFYVRQGADIIRLDAATYLWWELGTTCAHLVQTHAIIQLFRAVLDLVAPKVALVTETNAPHAENIRYFGDGANEANLVYNFALPPLVLHTFHTGNCRKLSRWAASATKPSDTATFFNILDSHDGIGLLGAKGILSETEIEALVRKAKAHGGFVSYRTNQQGDTSPYELNITWFDVLNHYDSAEDDDLQVSRYIASRAIALVLMGVPGIYFARFSNRTVMPILPSEIGEFRALNRAPTDEELLFRQMSDSASIPYKITLRLREIGEKRVASAAFHPNGRQRILMTNEAVFTVVRQSPDNRQLVVALTNVTARQQEIGIPEKELFRAGPLWRDLLSGETLRARSGVIRCTLQPYQVAWLAPEECHAGES